MKTADLTGPALDWAVAKCEGVSLIYRGRKWPTDGATTVEYAPWAVHPVVNGSGPFVAALCNSAYSPTTNWAHGGPIIEREGIELICNLNPAEAARFKTEPHWRASKRAWSKGDIWYGPTPLIAVMRCYVASKLGDEIDVPKELLA